MVELNTSIPLGVKVPEYNMLNDVADIVKLRTAQQQQQSNALALQEKQRALSEDQNMRDLLASGLDVNSPEFRQAAFNRAPNLYLSFEKNRLANEEQQRKNEAAKLEYAAKNVAYYKSMLPNVKDPETYAAWRDSAVKNMPGFANVIPTEYSEDNVKRLMADADKMLEQHFTTVTTQGPGGTSQTQIVAAPKYGIGEAKPVFTGQSYQAPETFTDAAGKVWQIDKATGIAKPVMTAPAQPQDATGQPQTPIEKQQAAAPGANLYNQERARSAISGVESGGKYEAMGPVTKNGDRAYGKYQVMGNNIPQWTKEALGVSMTPKEFLSNPAAQDAVFDYKFGQSVAKYGNVQDAASVWFSGRPMAQAGNASDVLGTTVPNYVSKFMAGYQTGPGTPRMATAQPFASTADIPLSPYQPTLPTTGFQPQPTNALAPQQQQAAQNALVMQQNQPTTAPLTPYQMPINRAPAQPVAPVEPAQLGAGAKAQSEYDTTLAKKSAESVASQAEQARGAKELLARVDYRPDGGSRVDDLIKQSTSGPIQATAAGGARLLGYSTEGQKALAQLKTLAEGMTIDILGGKLGAGISNEDRNAIQRSLGDIANENLPAEQRLASWREVKRRLTLQAGVPSAETSNAKGASAYSKMSDAEIKAKLGL